MKFTEPIWGVITGFSDDTVYATMCIALGDDREIRFSASRWFPNGESLQVGDTVIADFQVRIARKATTEDFEELGGLVENA